MTAATFSHSAGISSSPTQVKHASDFSLGALFHIMITTLAMARTVPHCSRITDNGMSKVRLIAQAI